eukprot:scaffold282382_cov36-Tisochrysis_lutea.AAC.1
MRHSSGSHTRHRASPPCVHRSGATGDATLYMRGVLESHYRDNLDRFLSELFRDGAVLIVTDPGVPSPCIKVAIKLGYTEPLWHELVLCKTANGQILATAASSLPLAAPTPHHRSPFAGREEGSIY